jgi:hypothetical protein
MAYRIAGIDVHKAMLAVVVADVDSEGGSGRSCDGISAPRRANSAA